MGESFKVVLEALVALELKQRMQEVAYESLLKGKEALEASLAALTSVKDKSSINEGKQSGDSNSKDAEGSSNLQLQIATLMNSLAILSAEKSRMEADKKQIRSELLLRDKTISKLQENIQELSKEHAVELEAMKSQVIIERQEREKETNNYMVKIRELQNERNLKENLETQLKDLKMKYSNVGDSDSENQELTTEQHVAFETEQRQAHTPEERRNLAALHEDCVANLEARIAELSTTVGTYDRLKSENSDLKQTVEVQNNRIKTLQEEVKRLNESLNDKKKMRTDLNACRSENSNLKIQVENLKKKIKILKIRLYS